MACDYIRITPSSSVGAVSALTCLGPGVDFVAASTDGSLTLGDSLSKQKVRSRGLPGHMELHGATSTSEGR